MKRIIPQVATLASAVLGSTLARSEVTIVGQSGSYATLQAAVDAASDGDTLIVGDGTYNTGCTVTNKSLALIAQAGVTHSIKDRVSVVNLGTGKRVLLSGLSITGKNSSFQTNPGVVVSDCAGSVSLRACVLKGGTYTSEFNPMQSGHGLALSNSSSVVASACTISGANAGMPSGYAARQGGHGVHAIASSVALWDCTVTGGTGSEETYPSGGQGGSGLSLSGSTAWAAGCTFKGGMGGGGDYIGCTTSGDGGDGATLVGAHMDWRDCAFVPGQAGNFSPCGQYGSSGQPVNSSASSGGQLTGSARHLAGPLGVTDNYLVPFTVQGAPGDQFWLIAAREPGFLFLASLSGVLAVPFPFRITFAPQGTLDAAGQLNLSLPIGDLSLPMPAQVWFYQGLCVDGAGQAYLTNPLALVVVDT
jgi:hypothetical protein